jgi:hypothetical protein
VNLCGRGEQNSKRAVERRRRKQRVRRGKRRKMRRARLRIKEDFRGEKEEC